MLLIQCVTAYVVLRELMEKEFDYKSAYRLMILSQKLKPHVDFYVSEEKKLIEKYGERDENGKVKMDGKSWTLRDPADAENYRADINALGAVPVDEFDEPIKISAAPMIKPSHLEALAGFIEFGGE